jgi:hypothetical protein
MAERGPNWDRYLIESSRALGQSLALQGQLDHMTAHHYAHMLCPLCPPEETHHIAPQQPQPIIVQQPVHVPAPAPVPVEQRPVQPAMINVPAPHVIVNPCQPAVTHCSPKEQPVRDNSDWKLTVLMMMGAIGLTVAVFIIVILSGLLTSGVGGGG